MADGCPRVGWEGESIENCDSKQKFFGCRLAGAAGFKRTTMAMRPGWMSGRTRRDRLMCEKLERKKFNTSPDFDRFRRKDSN